MLLSPFTARRTRKKKQGVAMTPILIFPVTRWTARKEKHRSIALESSSGGPLGCCKNKWVQEQMPETSLEANMTEPQLSDLGTS